jgi:hypothetical protein
LKIEKMSEEITQSSFSKYGLYTVNENLELTLPDTKIKFDILDKTLMVK